MRFILRSAAVAAAGIGLVAAISAQPVAAAAAARVPTVLHVGQIDQQDIAPRTGSEPQTLVEPDVAVSPLNPQIAVAASHDGRFAGGGRSISRTPGPTTVARRGTTHRCRA